MNKTSSLHWHLKPTYYKTGEYNCHNEWQKITQSLAPSKLLTFKDASSQDPALHPNKTPNQKTTSANSHPEVESSSLSSKYSSPTQAPYIKT